MEQDNQPQQVKPSFTEKIYTDEELQIIKDLYSDPKRLKLLRKVFLPQYDYDAPIGQAFDLMTIFPFEQHGTTERAFYTEVRRSMIKHIESRLIDLQVLASEKDAISDEERAKLDSTK